MIARTETRKLSEIAGLALCAVEIDELAPCEPGTEDARVIVEIDESGRIVDIVDGFHRTGGMARWADESGTARADVSVTVVVVRAEGEDDEDLIAAAADRDNPDQDDALDSIYEAVS